GETGFDLGAVEEQVAEPAGEPRPASAPPGARRRFTVVVDGPTNGDLVEAWAKLCQEPPTPEFRTVYPFLTTVQGNRFRFRGGDPVVLREQIERLIHGRLNGTRVSTHVEN